jgi:hypothetical protein
MGSIGNAISSLFSLHANYVYVAISFQHMSNKFVAFATFAIKMVALCISL